MGRENQVLAVHPMLIARSTCRRPSRHVAVMLCGLLWSCSSDTKLNSDVLLTPDARSFDAPAQLDGQVPDSKVDHAVPDAAPASGTWIKETAPSTLTGRFSGSMTGDPVSKRVLVMGGRVGNTLASDLWVWQGKTWSQQTPAGAAPAARFSHAAAYDSKRGRLVVFSGLAALAGNTYLGDTWEWDNNTWLEVTPGGASPSKRAGHAMAFDAARGKVLLFGGLGADGKDLQDTWEWDGTTWKELTGLTTKPPGRFNITMAYDAARQRVVLFGGHSLVAISRADTWEWDGSAWQEMNPAGDRPPAIGFHRMAYDPVRKQVLLHGGSDALPPFTLGKIYSDLWSWDGKQWRKATPTGPDPGSRVGHGLAYDRAGSRLLLMGGYNGVSVVGDLWRWAPN